MAILKKITSMSIFLTHNRFDEEKLWLRASVQTRIDCVSYSYSVAMAWFKISFISSTLTFHLLPMHFQSTCRRHFLAYYSLLLINGKSNIAQNLGKNNRSLLSQFSLSFGYIL